MTEHTRLLLQLKSKRSLWGSEPEAAEVGQDGTDSPQPASVSPAKEASRPQAPDGEDAGTSQKLGSENGTAGNGDGPSTGETAKSPRTGDSQGTIATEKAEVASSDEVRAEKTGQNGQSNPIDNVESMI